MCSEVRWWRKYSSRLLRSMSLVNYYRFCRNSSGIGMIDCFLCCWWLLRLYPTEIDSGLSKFGVLLSGTIRSSSRRKGRPLPKKSCSRRNCPSVGFFRKSFDLYRLCLLPGIGAWSCAVYFGGHFMYKSFPFFWWDSWSRSTLSRRYTEQAIFWKV